MWITLSKNKLAELCKPSSRALLSTINHILKMTYLGDLPLNCIPKSLLNEHHSVRVD